MSTGSTMVTRDARALPRWSRVTLLMSPWNGTKPHPSRVVLGGSESVGVSGSSHGRLSFFTNAKRRDVERGVSFSVIFAT